MLPQTSPTSNPAELLDAALKFAARRWSIIPTIGKRAAGLWKPFQDRPADGRTLRRMFARKGITGLAVILGSASGGLACRDYDDADAYRRWAAAHPDLAATLPTVKTSRGYHVYFAGPDGFHDLEYGEYRGDAGHYCLLPPSAHPNGPIYTWRIPLPDGELPVLDPVRAGLLTLTQADSSKLKHPSRSSKDKLTHTQAPPKQTQSYTLHVSDGSIDDVIRATLPNGPGQRNRRLFDLARRLKSVMPDATMDSLEVIVRAWHTRALAIITTKEWLITWIDFRTAWAKVKRPIGATMAEIVTAAKGQTPTNADAIGKLTSLCRSLQEHHGAGRVWPLACRMAGSKIGVGHDTAARIIKMLCSEGTIELVTPAGPKGSKRAAEYRFLGGMS